MRAFVGRLSANVGSGLAAGGSVLAVGAALGAVGLAETQGRGSAFDNGWVLAGVIIIASAALWTIGLFCLAMRATAKHEQFQELLGHALNDGEQLAADDAPIDETRAWTQQASDLIRIGLGSGEDRLFLGDWDFGPQYLTGEETRGQPSLQRRLRRLMGLMDHLHSIHVGAGVKLPNWQYISRAVVQSPLATTRDLKPPRPTRRGPAVR